MDLIPIIACVLERHLQVLEQNSCYPIILGTKRAFKSTPSKSIKVHTISGNSMNAVNGAGCRGMYCITHVILLRKGVRDFLHYRIFRDFLMNFTLKKTKRFLQNDTPLAGGCIVAASDYKIASHRF